MLKLGRSSKILALTLLTVLGSPAIAQAQTNEVQSLHADLQFAVCKNDWDQAIRRINPLIAAPQLTEESRLELIQFRYQLQNWRAMRARFSRVEGCNEKQIAAIAETDLTEMPERDRVTELINRYRGPFNWGEGLGSLYR